MGDLADTAAAILSVSERRLEISAQNVANMTTPGYKRRLSFDSILKAGAAGQDSLTTAAVVRDFTVGKLSNTENPGDLALSHKGFFMVEGPNGALYTRQGNFHRDGDGRLVTSKGWPLQAAGGGDVVVKSDAFKVQADGTVTENGDPISKIAVMDFSGAPRFEDGEAGFIRADDASMAPVDSPDVRQGYLETSNVSTADEMVAMMDTIRRAEAGQRLFNVYDDLMGRALNVFGQA